MPRLALRHVPALRLVALVTLASCASAPRDPGTDRQDDTVQAIPSRPCWCASPSAASGASGACASAAAHEASKKPALLGVYTLPATRLDRVDPLLTPRDLSAGLANGAGTITAPGLGSGLDYAGECGFYMVTDRGPNDARAAGGKTFPVPAFTPTIAQVHVDDAAHIALDATWPLRDASGAPVTGLSNDAHDDAPYLNQRAAQPLPYDPAGLDTEDVRRLPNGDFLVTDEYGPSLALVDGATGRVSARYVPQGRAAHGEGYPVYPILPAILQQRRANKGLESLAVSRDGTTAYAFMQSALGDEDDYGKSRVIRAVRIADPGDPSRARVTGHFLVVASDAGDYPATKQTGVFFNSGAWLASDRVLLLERGATKLRLVTADFTEATNLLAEPHRGEDSLAPEGLKPKELADAGLTPAATEVVFDSDDLPAFLGPKAVSQPAPSKLEGLAVIDAHTVAIANDNDFGITDPRDATRIWVVRLSASLRR